MKGDRLRLRYLDDPPTLERQGTDTPKGSRVVADGGGLIVAKVAGSHYYGGQGRPQNYHGAKFVVYEQVEAEDADGWILAVERVSWPVVGATR